MPGGGGGGGSGGGSGGGAGVLAGHELTVLETTEVRLALALLTTDYLLLATRYSALTTHY